MGLLQVFAAVLCMGLPMWVTAGGGDPNFVWDGGPNAPEWTIAELQDNLRDKRDQKRFCLVMFHVSWCKVCQRTFPEFIAAANRIASTGLEVDFAHIDCEKSTCTGYLGRGYPTIRLYPFEEDAINRTYKSQRKEDAFVRYAERMTKPAVRMGLSRADLAKAHDNETLSAYVIALPDNKAVPPTVKAAAKQWMDLHIFAASKRLEDLLPEGVSVPEKSSLAVLSSPRQQWPGHDNSSTAKPSVVFFEGDLSNQEEVDKWVQRNRFAGIWKLDDSNFFEFTHADRKASLLAVDPMNCSKATEATWRGAAAELREEFIFGVVDSKAWDQELMDFNLHQQDMPRILVAEENFEVWVEDLEGLRVATALEDLRAYVSGSKQLLRQARTTMSRLWFYHREGRRYLIELVKYAEQGPLQATLVALGTIATFIVFFLICWGLCTVVSFLFSDPDYEAEYAQKKRN